MAYRELLLYLSQSDLSTLPSDMVSCVAVVNLKNEKSGRLLAVLFVWGDKFDGFPAIKPALHMHINLPKLRGRRSFSGPGLKFICVLCHTSDGLIMLTARASMRRYDRHLYN